GPAGGHQARRSPRGGAAMSRKLILGAAALVLLAASGSKSGADFEADLLAKFRRQNEAAAVALKEEVVQSQSPAEALAASDPGKAAELLRTCLRKLKDDAQLSATERSALIHQVEDLLHRVMKALPEKSPAQDPGTALQDRTRPKSSNDPGEVRQAGGATFPATPAVTAPGRYVRVGVLGSGTVGGAGVRIGTTVTVPDGGTAVLG